MCVVGEEEKEAKVTYVHLLTHSIQYRYRRKCHVNTSYYKSQLVRLCDFNFCSPSLISPADLFGALFLGQQLVDNYNHFVNLQNSQRPNAVEYT